MREESLRQRVTQPARRMGRPLLTRRETELGPERPVRSAVTWHPASYPPAINKRETGLSLAVPNLGPHPTLFLAEFPTAFATFLNAHTLLISSRVRSHTPLPRCELGGENLVRAIGSEH